MGEEKKHVHVCSGRSCKAFGAEGIMRTLEAQTGLRAGEENDTMSLDYCGCLGYCQTSPNVYLEKEHFVFNANEETVLKEIEEGGTYHPGVIIDLDGGDSAFLYDIKNN